MSINYHILSNSMVLNFNGQTHTINKNDERYAEVLEAIKQDKLEAIPAILDVGAKLNVPGLVFKDNQVYIDDEVIPSELQTKILQFKKENLPFDYLIKFVKKLRQNPSYNSRQQLYKFLEHNGHPLTKEGNFIAYRGVSEDFKDIHTKTFNNAPGSICEMSRLEVDDNPNNTCSSGLHVACFNYAKDFGKKLVEVEVNPADVVCVPTDYDGTKMRVCKFKVLNEVSVLNTSTLVDSGYADENDDNEEDYVLNPIYQVQINNYDSSIILEALYHIITKDLRITLTNGKVYIYKDVPKSVIADWEGAISSGSFWNKKIKPVYVCTLG